MKIKYLKLKENLKLKIKFTALPFARPEFVEGSLRVVILA